MTRVFVTASFVKLENLGDMFVRGMVTSDVPISQGGYSCVLRIGLHESCDSQAESGAKITIPGTELLAAGAGDPGAAASGGDEGEVGAAFSPGAVGVDAGAVAGALASNGADWAGGSTALGGSGKSQGRATIAAGMILRTHMRTRPSGMCCRERSHSLPGGCAYHTFTVILSLDRVPLEVDVLREIPHEG